MDAHEQFLDYLSGDEDITLDGAKEILWRHVDLRAPAHREDSGLSIGSVALVIAAQKGNVDIARYLCSNGVEVDFADANGLTPFYWAIWNGDRDIVRFLWDASADKHQLVSVDATPLYIAAARGHLEIVILLFDLCPQPSWFYDKPMESDYAAHLNVVRILCDTHVDVEDNHANRIAEPAHEVAANSGAIWCARWLYYQSGLPW